jgi:hypothetical protein
MNESDAVLRKESAFSRSEEKYRESSLPQKKEEQEPNDVFFDMYTVFPPVWRHSGSLL